MHGVNGADAMMSMENIGEQVYVSISENLLSQLLKKFEDGAKLAQDEQTNIVTHRRHITGIRMVQYF